MFDFITKQHRFDFLIRLINLGLFFGTTINLENYELDDQDVALLLSNIKNNEWLKNNLKELNLKGNKLTSLVISGFPNLNVLNVSNNFICVLKVVNLPKLAVFHANNNMLTQIDLSTLTGLICIILKNNQLKAVKFDKHPHLVTLDLFSNNLKSSDLCLLNTLENLDISANPLVQIFTAGTNLAMNIAYSSAALNHVSYLDLKHRQATAADPVKFIDYDMLPARFNGQELNSVILSKYFTDALESYKKQHAPNALTECAKVFYWLRSNRIINDDTAYLVAIHLFYEQIFMHFGILAKHLITLPEVSGNDEIKHFISSYSNNELKLILVKTCENALKILKNNQALSKSVTRSPLHKLNELTVSKPDPLVWLARQVRAVAPTENDYQSSIRQNRCSMM